MDIRLETRDVTLPSNGGNRLMDQAARALGRLGSHIDHVNLTLKDVNGPKGGRDKVCMLQARLNGGGEVVVVERRTNMRRAVSVCLRRAKAAIARKVALQRRHERQHRRQRYAEPAMI